MLNRQLGLNLTLSIRGPELVYKLKRSKIPHARDFAAGRGGWHLFFPLERSPPWQVVICSVVGALAESEDSMPIK
jgi:hypothetical protein